MHYCNNSSALAMELMQFCTKPWMCTYMLHDFPFVIFLPWRPSYFRWIISMPWLLMAWLFAMPDHLAVTAMWIWNKWYKMQICYMLSKNNSPRKRLATTWPDTHPVITPIFPFILNYFIMSKWKWKPDICYHTLPLTNEAFLIGSPDNGLKL